jgi:transposase, IS5 family
VLCAVDSSGGVERFMKQATFASAARDRKGKMTRRERFLAKMDAVIPWSTMLALIEPHYPKAGNGTRPMPAGPDIADLLHAAVVQPVGSDRRGFPVRLGVDAPFAGIERVDDAIPDESTSLG